MNKSLYNKTDERVITELLRFLNKGASKVRALRRIEDGDEWWRRQKALMATDSHTNAVVLVDVLNSLTPEQERWSPFVGRSWWRNIINTEMLKKCLVFPQITIRNGREWDVAWAAAPDTPPTLRTFREVVPKILFLHVRGLLSRMRQCRSTVCEKWFFAEHGKTRFHSELCRSRAHYANLSPQAKAHRRKLMRDKMRERRAMKMREYRALEKKRSERALRLAMGLN